MQILIAYYSGSGNAATVADLLQTNWRDAGTTVNSSGFGQVNNVLSARVIQLYLKINF